MPTPRQHVQRIRVNMERPLVISSLAFVERWQWFVEYRPLEVHCGVESLPIGPRRAQWSARAESGMRRPASGEQLDDVKTFV